MAIEACWLAAITTTVLAFQGRAFFFHFTQPKQNLLHLFALAILCLWAIDIALARASVDPSADRGAGRGTWRFWEWAGANPARWLIVFVVGFTAAQILSTAFSPLPWVSIFGRDLNDAGYELYSGLSYMVILGAIAFRIRSLAPLKRLLLAIGVSGTLAGAYGVSQHFGWDPIGFGAGLGRVRSSLGNPIFLASVLVMSACATVAAYLLYDKAVRSWWTVVAAAAIALQIAAIWFSGSRGPLVATVVGASAMAITGLLLLNRGQIVRASIVGTTGVIAGVVIILLPAPESAGGRSGLEIIGSILNQAAAATGTEVNLTGSNLATDNVGNRLDIWNGAIDLLRTRESLEDGGPTVTFLRHLFGYGPDMYYFSYSLTAPPRSQFAVVSHAHDFALHIWLELGLFGILCLVGITISGALVLVQSAWRVRRGGLGAHGPALAVITTGLVGILAGRMVEQTVGVARVADLTIFWAIVGAVVLMGRITEARGMPDADPIKRPVARQVSRRSAAESYQLWVGGAIALSVFSLTLWIAADGTALYASRVAAIGNHAINSGEEQEGYDRFRDAARIDKFSESYGMVAAQLERSAAVAQEDPEKRLENFLVAYTTLAEYEQTNPWAVNNDVRLTWLISAIANLGVEQAKGELWDRTVELDLRMRPYPKVMAFVANSYIALGEFELGIEVADYAIETAESVGLEVAQAWWAKGEALGRIGREDEALHALQTATEVEPDSQFASLAHKTLAEYYEENGDAALAETHRERASEIDRKLAEAS